MAGSQTPDLLSRKANATTRPPSFVICVPGASGDEITPHLGGTVPKSSFLGVNEHFQVKGIKY